MRPAGKNREKAGIRGIRGAAGCRYDALILRLKYHSEVTEKLDWRRLSVGATNYQERLFRCLIRVRAPQPSNTIVEGSGTPVA